MQQARLAAIAKKTPYSLDCISNIQNNPSSNRGTKFELPRGLERKYKKGIVLNTVRG